LSALGLVLKVSDDGQIDVSVNPEKISVVLELLSSSSTGSGHEKMEKGRAVVNQNLPDVLQNQQP